MIRFLKYFSVLLISSTAFGLKSPVAVESMINQTNSRLSHRQVQIVLRLVDRLCSAPEPKGPANWIELYADQVAEVAATLQYKIPNLTIKETKALSKLIFSKEVTQNCEH